MLFYFPDGKTLIFLQLWLKFPSECLTIQFNQKLYLKEIYYLWQIRRILNF